MKKIVVIGGGFFGMYLAEHFAKSGHEVCLVERESEFMTRASYANQARVHNGYHYPRSILTALRSRVSFPRFVAEFGDCVKSDFEQYYLVGKLLGKVSGRQFAKFCERIGAAFTEAPRDVLEMTNPNLIETCLSTVEYAFDAIALRDAMKQRISGSSIECRMGTTVKSIRTYKDGLLLTLVRGSDRAEDTVYADHAFNCTYSGINQVLSDSEIEIIPLKHEMTEMCLVNVPESLKKRGFTVMCGPFFSVMPFPSTDFHSFSHVRYTPHYEWHDKLGEACVDPNQVYREAQRNTAWKYMIKDAVRYIPALAACEYVESLWEVKTVLPRSESDDSRPILFKANHRLRGLHCVMGGKIDNIYDAVSAIESQRLLS